MPVRARACVYFSESTSASFSKTYLWRGKPKERATALDAVLDGEQLGLNAVLQAAHLPGHVALDKRSMC